MAITSKLPLSKWYTEVRLILLFLFVYYRLLFLIEPFYSSSKQKTSEWTLDYPPFFAYFELFLSYFAPYFDPDMLKISATPYASPNTVFFMRLTVIASDAVYLYAAYVWLRLLTDPAKHLVHGLGLRARPPSLTRSEQWTSSAFLYIFLFLVNVGHLLVDHIHFQYNGLLNGLLLLSAARMVDGQIYWSALWFAVLLNLKHIYLYAAPAYLFFLFIEYCLTIDRSSLLQSKLHPGTVARLGAIVLAVFGLSFGPFIAQGQLPALLGRLFPFNRGLSHAYWAPNFWALYNGADLVLARLLRRGGAGGGITSGLVKVSEHAVLPSISPSTSLIIVVFFIIVSIFVLSSK